MVNANRRNEGGDWGDEGSAKRGNIRVSGERPLSKLVPTDGSIAAGARRFFQYLTFLTEKADPLRRWCLL